MLIRHQRRFENLLLLSKLAKHRSDNPLKEQNLFVFLKIYPAPVNISDLWLNTISKNSQTNIKIQKMNDKKNFSVSFLEIEGEKFANTEKSIRDGNQIDSQACAKAKKLSEDLI